MRKKEILSSADCFASEINQGFVHFVDCVRAVFKAESVNQVRFFFVKRKACDILDMSIERINEYDFDE